jgi:hypothetical protein
MPVEWSSGWLLARMIELGGGLPPAWNDGITPGFGLDDPEYDPTFDEQAEPPVGWERLPMEGDA